MTSNSLIFDMIYSPARRYLFIHIPKTGGTSMALALEAKAAKDDILVGDTPKAKKRRGRLGGIKTAGRLWKHSSLRDLTGMFEPKDFDGLFVFTIVRNPWDRIVSYYHWLKKQTFDHPAVTLAKSLNFKEFLNNPHIQKSFHENPYSSYVTCADGHMQGDLFIRLEHLEQDMEMLTRHLGFQLNLPHVNRSDRLAEYQAYYDDNDRCVVERVCHQDIQYFEYQFD